jgi:threonine dehydrogenase-like Zn-dependent dehydrogenase
VGYKSRGTGKCHGFASEYFVDTADWLVKVELPRVHQPEDELERKRITNRCVLAEPLSIVWKARREILKHHTIHECKDKVLIVGAGPIGLLAGVVMKNLHPGLEYTVVDLAEPTNIRAQFVQDLGLEYLQAPGEHAVPAKIAARKFDILIEATDRPHDVFAAYSGLLKGGGVFMMIGIPEGDSGVTIQPALFNQFVKNRNVLIGSINSNRSDFEESIAFLRRVVSGPHPVLDRMITMVPVDDNTGSKLTTFGAEPRNARTYVKLVVEPK